MGHVTEARAEAILEEVLKEWLNDGNIPTTEELDEAYNKAIKEFGPLSSSGLRKISPPQRYEESSANVFNSTIEFIEGDIDILLRSLVKLNELSIKLLSEWNARGQNLIARATKLKARIETLILLKSDTAGYVAFVEDGFLSLENVSSDTTALIDTKTGEVTLNVNRNEGEGVYQGTQVNLTDSDVSLSFIESNNIDFVSRNSGPVSIANINSDRLNRVGMEVRARRPSSIVTSSLNSKPIIAKLLLLHQMLLPEFLLL
jgi:hypothetical protein